MRSLILPAVLGISLLGIMPRASSAKEAKPLPATIVVHLPADARLAIDGHPTRSTSATRSFITPALERGRLFHYTLKVDFVRGGETVTLKKVVAVRAGRETVVALDPPTTDNPAPDIQARNEQDFVATAFSSPTASLGAQTPNRNWEPRANVH